MLGTPPAFVLSQDQTLKNLYLKLFPELKIKLLNNLLLASITQEFSLAVFSLTLKQSIYCPRCFIVVCVIQFTRYSVLTALAVSLLSISRALYFVKNFFRPFSFSFARNLLSLPSLSKQLAYITTPLSLCQAQIRHFLKKFGSLRRGFQIHLFSYSASSIRP